MGKRLPNKEEVMNCALCKHGVTKPGQTTVTLQRGDTTVIVKQVPAEICDTCGEYYLADEVTSTVLEKAEAAVRSGAEVQILRFAA
jgi:YgiT-type zinc finger domain-containing protein